MSWRSLSAFSRKKDGSTRHCESSTATEDIGSAAPRGSSWPIGSTNTAASYPVFPAGPCVLLPMSRLSRIRTCPPSRLLNPAHTNGCVVSAKRISNLFEAPMDIIVSGSLAYDRIMDFPGHFSDHILPEKIHTLNVCFQVDGMKEKFGGTAGNIAYALTLMGEKPAISATIGRDYHQYFKWLEQNGISHET